MNALLDTHTLIWAMLNPPRLSRTAAAVLTDESNSLFVSAATAWEIATKVRLGKLPGAEILERRFVQSVEEAGYTFLSVSTEVALRGGRLVGAHKDPFDRLIAAHALAQDMPVVSADPKLDLFGVRRIW